jgi:hypothetical protein
MNGLGQWQMEESALASGGKVRRNTFFAAL